MMFVLHVLRFFHSMEHRVTSAQTTPSEARSKDALTTSVIPYLSMPALHIIAAGLLFGTQDGPVVEVVAASEALLSDGRFDTEVLLKRIDQGANMN
jgi:hypothetical protein